MTNNMTHYIRAFEAGTLSRVDALGLMVFILNNNIHELAQRYAQHIHTVQQAGAIRYDEAARRWYVHEQAQQQQQRKRGGRPRKTRELVPVSIYLDPAVAEALDRLVNASTISRSAYINFIIKRFLQDRKEI